MGMRLQWVCACCCWQWPAKNVQQRWSESKGFSECYPMWGCGHQSVDILFSTCIPARKVLVPRFLMCSWRMQRVRLVQSFKPPSPGHCSLWNFAPKRCSLTWTGAKGICVDGSGIMFQYAYNCLHVEVRGLLVSPMFHAIISIEEKTCDEKGQRVRQWHYSARKGIRSWRGFCKMTARRKKHPTTVQFPQICSKESGPRMAKDEAYAERVPET